MKKLLMGLSLMFVCVVAFAHTINWHVGDQIISTTTCDSGDSITPPTVPSKRGYHLKEWTSVYMRLEYIKSNGRAYINTGININSGSEFEIRAKIAFTNTGSEFNFSGIMGGAYFGKTNNKYFFNVTETDIAADNNVHDIVFGCNSSQGAYLQIDNGEPVYSRKGWASGEICFFNLSTPEYGFGQVLESAEIYVQGVLVQNLIPAKRNSDNVLGMYDTVSGTFFTNAGTGTFIAGPAVGGL